jgi:hypothetical protein
MGMGVFSGAAAVSAGFGLHVEKTNAANDKPNKKRGKKNPEIPDHMTGAVFMVSGLAR